jgi:hypothetical protein
MLLKLDSRDGDEAGSLPPGADVASGYCFDFNPVRRHTCSCPHQCSVLCLSLNPPANPSMLASVRCQGAVCKGSQRALITETNRTQLILFGIQNRMLGPYLTAIHRGLISAMCV